MAHANAIFKTIGITNFFYLFSLQIYGTTQKNSKVKNPKKSVHFADFTISITRSLKRD